MQEKSSGASLCVEITLPWPPSANQMYRHVGKKVLISERGRKYRLQVAEELAKLGSPRLEGALALSVLAFPPDNRRRDLDNTLKNLQDSLAKAGLFEDDSQIARLEVVRQEPTPGGRLIVTAKELDYGHRI